MTTKTKIGVLLVTSGWFRDVGLQSADGKTTDQVNDFAEQIIRKLKAFLEPVFSGVLYSVEEAREAGRRIKSSAVDGLLLSPLMWCEDQIVRAALEELADLPIILWTFSPTSTLPEYVPFQTMLQGSGAVCTLQLSGMLRREGFRYQSTAGPLEDPRVFQEIEQRTRAMLIARKLKETRVGVLPFPCAQMSTTYVDEFKLRVVYGIELRYLEIERFRRTARDIPEEAVRTFRQEIEQEGIEVEVDETDLAEGIKYALAMEKILIEEEIDVLAMNDITEEMHTSFGMRPSLTNPGLSRAGIVVAMEADIATGIAMSILQQFTGLAPMYTEPFSIDYEQNALLLGHAGYLDSINRDPALPVKIVSDAEYENSDRFSGAVTYFKYKPGPVTLINSVWDGERIKWMVAEGDSMAGPFKMEGNSHLFCRLKADVRQFFQTAVENGVSQHWAVVSGHLLPDLERLCTNLNIRFHS